MADQGLYLFWAGLEGLWVMYTKCRLHGSGKALEEPTKMYAQANHFIKIKNEEQQRSTLFYKKGITLVQADAGAKLNTLAAPWFPTSPFHHPIPMWRKTCPDQLFPWTCPRDFLGPNRESRFVDFDSRI